MKPRNGAMVSATAQNRQKRRNSKPDFPRSFRTKPLWPERDLRLQPADDRNRPQGPSRDRAHPRARRGRRPGRSAAAGSGQAKRRPARQVVGRGCRARLPRGRPAGRALQDALLKSPIKHQVLRAGRSTWRARLAACSSGPADRNPPDAAAKAPPKITCSGSNSARKGQVRCVAATVTDRSPSAISPQAMDGARPSIRPAKACWNGCLDIKISSQGGVLCMQSTR